MSVHGKTYLLAITDAEAESLRVYVRMGMFRGITFRLW
jgi:hypothetical protein